VVTHETYGAGSKGDGGEGAAGEATNQYSDADRGKRRWWRVKNPMPGDASIFIFMGLVQLVPAFSIQQRFHALLATALFLSAGSFLVGFWKRSGNQAWDRLRGPLTVLLIVWAMGLYVYCTGIAPASAFNRFVAGFSGSVYVLGFAIEVLTRPRVVAFGEAGGSGKS